MPLTIMAVYFHKLWKVNTNDKNHSKFITFLLLNFKLPNLDFSEILKNV